MEINSISGQSLCDICFVQCILLKTNSLLTTYNKNVLNNICYPPL